MVERAGDGVYDAIVVGSGPNGLAAAVVLARAGRSVLVREAADTLGGGARSAELTLPGFVHDVCSASTRWVSPRRCSDAAAGGARPGVGPPAGPAGPPARRRHGRGPRSARVDATAARLGPDAAAYQRLMDPLVARFDRLATDLLGPLRLPRHPLALARFGLLALLPHAVLARWRSARASGRGRCSPGMRRPRHPAAGPTRRAPRSGWCSAARGHAVGWPMPRGGSQRIADALASYLRSLGGEIVDRRAGRVASTTCRRTRAVLLDLTPRQLLRDRGPPPDAAVPQRLERYRYGPGIFKVDWALDGPIPWRPTGCRAGRDGPPRRHARGDRGGARGRVGGAAPRAAVRPARPADPLRPDAGAGRASTPPGPTATSRTARRST